MLARDAMDHVVSLIELSDKRNVRDPSEVSENERVSAEHRL